MSITEYLNKYINQISFYTKENKQTCSSKETTLGWTLSKVKWDTTLETSSGNFVRLLPTSVKSCLEITRLTFSFTTVNKTIFNEIYTWKSINYTNYWNK